MPSALSTLKVFLHESHQAHQLERTYLFFHPRTVWLHLNPPHYLRVATRLVRGGYHTCQCDSPCNTDAHACSPNSYLVQGTDLTPLALKALPQTRLMSMVKLHTAESYWQLGSGPFVLLLLPCWRSLQMQTFWISGSILTLTWIS